MAKKRLLLCNEASYLSTGFSTYGLEVLKRLHATDKYEVAEYASYGPPDDERSQDLPWQYFTAMPQPGNEAESQQYHSKKTNEFGEWKFEEVCLAFKPDIVWDIRDWWMLEYQERSPFRKYFHWAIMPTVDADPQDEQWIATFMSADAVFAYSDYGTDTLNRQSNKLIKTKGSAPPGADLATFNPVPDKNAHKQGMGLPPDSLIIGTVMRNQPRKLFPDLIEAFAKFLATAPKELASRAYLYLHTSYPDIGWDIPRLIKEFGVTHRTLFTYHCQLCGSSFPSHFHDAKAVCRHCGRASALLPNSFAGVSREVLCKVMNAFDCYVQYATCEGFGMPQVDAAACGLPVFAVDYSAMADVVRKIQGIPVKVQRYFRESETQCRRALPDNDDFVEKLVDFLRKPQSVRLRMGREARKAVEQTYTWDRTAKVWEDHFDSVACPPHDLTWHSPASYHAQPTKVPDGLSCEEFVRWGIQDIAGRPDLLNSYMALRLTRDLNWGSTTGGTGGGYFNENSMLGQRARLREFRPEDALNELRALCQQRNYWEQRRTAGG